MGFTAGIVTVCGLFILTQYLDLTGMAAIATALTGMWGIVLSVMTIHRSTAHLENHDERAHK